MVRCRAVLACLGLCLGLLLVLPAADAVAKKSSAKKTCATVQKKTVKKTSAKAPSAKKKTATRSKASRSKACPPASRVWLPGAEGEEAPCYRLRAGVGRCEPQCIPYARCRSGIMSCRTGCENGPVTWYRCEEARGNTSLEPREGSVLILGRNPHGMPTGHALYVESTRPLGDGRHELVLSHSNYDRRCHLERNATMIYHRHSQTLDVRTGHWAAWGRDLKVAGFILK